MIRHAGNSSRCDSRPYSVTHPLREPGFGIAKSRTCASGNPVSNGFKDYGCMGAPSAHTTVVLEKAFYSGIQILGGADTISWGGRQGITLV